MSIWNWFGWGDKKPEYRPNEDGTELLGGDDFAAWLDQQPADDDGIPLEYWDEFLANTSQSTEPASAQPSELDAFLTREEWDRNQEALHGQPDDPGVFGSDDSGSAFDTDTSGGSFYGNDDPGIFGVD